MEDRVREFFIRRNEQVVVHCACKVETGSLPPGTAGFFACSRSTVGFFRDSGEVLIAFEENEVSQHALNQRRSEEPSEPCQLKISLHGQDITTRGPDSGETFTFLGEQRWASRDHASQLLTDMIRAASERRQAQQAEVGAQQGPPPAPASQQPDFYPTSDSARSALLEGDMNSRLVFEQLVQTGILTPEQFWEQRELALAAEGAKPRFQRAGIATALPPSSRDIDNIRLTTGQQEQILSSEPGVREAYDELVPTRLTAQDFWTRYFRAQTFWQQTRLNSDIAGLGGQPEDHKFYSLHEESERHYTADGSLIPAKISRLIDNDVDLTADDDTLFGDTEGDLERNAGYGVGASADGEVIQYPEELNSQTRGLLRRFNSTSSVALRAAAGEGGSMASNLAVRGDLPEAPRDHEGESDDTRNHIRGRRREIRDLEDDDAYDGAELSIQDPRLYFQRIAGEASAAHTSTRQTFGSESLEGLRDAISQFTLTRRSSSDKGGGSAPQGRPTGGSVLLRKLPHSHARKQDRAPGDGEGICQASAPLVNTQTICTELLRHFWACVDNPAQAERAAKVAAAIQNQLDFVTSTLKSSVPADEHAACDALAKMLKRAQEKHSRVLQQRKKRPAPPSRAKRPAPPSRQRFT